MNLSEVFVALKNNGLSDLDIANKCGISQPTVTRLRNKKGNPKNIHPSTLKALADAFGYELKYEHGEPQFYKKEEIPGTRARDNPEAERADEIYQFLKKEVGIGGIGELKQLFNDFGAVLGTNQNEIRDLLAKICALDAIRNLAKIKK